jgi:hypothetical protein
MYYSTYYIVLHHTSTTSILLTGKGREWYLYTCSYDVMMQGRWSSRLSNNSFSNPAATPWYDLDHFDSSPKLLESNASEWLGEDVRELLPRADELEDNLSSIGAIMDKVITRVEVLRPRRIRFLVKGSWRWRACSPPLVSVHRALAPWARKEADLGWLPSRLSLPQQYTLLH